MPRNSVVSCIRASDHVELPLDNHLDDASSKQQWCKFYGIYFRSTGMVCVPVLVDSHFSLWPSD
jgi:hypothetical protein